MPSRIPSATAPVVPPSQPSSPETEVRPAAPFAARVASNVALRNGADLFEVSVGGAARSIARDIETVFTPGDAARQMELGALDEIIAARKADPRTFEPGKNPYRIEYAIYNMTDKDVIGRLTEAARAGIQVQVLIDAGQIDPSKPWNTVVDELKAGGLTSHAETQVGLSPEALRDTQIIEIDLPGSGLFHFKSRYFAYPDPDSGKIKETLLTGSHNPQTSAHNNDESLHRITDPKLIKSYMDAIFAIRDGQPVQNTWNESSPVNVMFTAPNVEGPKAVDKIFDLVAAEKELICLPMFTLRNIMDSTKSKRLVDELVAAQARGVKVVVITDHKQADGVDAQGNPRPDIHDDNTDDLLQAAGIPTWEVLNTAGSHTAMHLKSAIFGVTNPTVVTDAGNWTNATFGGKNYKSKNAESLLFIEGRYDDNHTGHKYLGEFMRLLRKYTPKNPGQPDAETLIRDMQSLPNWPKVKVSFDVLARTYWGQDVYITGSHPELGGWGATGPGVKLDTNPDTYPYWSKTELEMPMGTMLEYKVIKRSPDGRVEWEPGQNAMVVVDPTLGPDTEQLTVKDDFNGDTH